MNCQPPRRQPSIKLKGTAVFLLKINKEVFKLAKIMIQGTGSSVGKSILVTALCRIFKQDGYTVCPYKSQNMALNSYITHDGKEMGRAQVLQAYAAGLEPEAYMNPILLKPTGDKKSQIIFNGEVYGNSTAMEYHNMKTKFGKKLKEQFKDIEEKFDIVVIEGAGSPAEINLRDKDIVNMGFAEMVDAPVLLAGDIDRGGVFASLAGTMLLLTEEEKKRVKGTLINKFRGDIEILKPGLKMLEDIIKRPTVGVVPYLKLQLEDEDGAVEFNRNINAPIDIAVIKLPRISNFTDFDALKIEEDVSIRYITTKEDFGNPDLLIIPGTKNTIEDLLELRKCGLEDKIKEYSKTGTVIGICGGYQMLGKTLKDPYKVESDELETEGMGLLNVDTVFEKEKITTRVKAKSKDTEVYGYEVANLNLMEDVSSLKDELNKVKAAIKIKKGIEPVEKENSLSFTKNLQEQIKNKNYSGVYFDINSSDEASQENINEAELKEYLELSEDTLLLKKRDLEEKISKFNFSYLAEFSGIVTYKIDGNEDYFKIDNLDKFTYKYLNKNYNFKSLEMETKVKNGDPLFKIVNNLNWKVACTINNVSQISNYNLGDSVKIQIPEIEDIYGIVEKINKDNNHAVIIVSLDRYFENMYSNRIHDGKIIVNKTKGFEIPKSTLIERDNLTGVYVQEIKGLVKFVPVEIVSETNDYVFINKGNKESVISIGDKSYKTVTVNDAIVINPKTVDESRILN